MSRVLLIEVYIIILLLDSSSDLHQIYYINTLSTFFSFGKSQYIIPMQAIS